MADPRVGTAGWSIPTALAEGFPSDGTSLERYAVRFRCAEINSSFHRSHRPGTYQRWAGSVPEDFRFSAKLSKTITHKQKLVACEPLLDLFMEEVSGLGSKLAVILVQLPPSLSFDPQVAGPFFEALRQRTDLQLACEPRHPSWFEPNAGQMLTDFRIAGVAADPPRVEAAASPSGWNGMIYYRLHGFPVAYRSSYDDGRLDRYAAAIASCAAQQKPVWCIFDNTASSAAAGDALKLMSLV